MRSGLIRIRRPWLDAFAVRAGVAAAMLVTIAVGVLLLWRRLSGEASLSLPPGMLFATASFAGVMVIGGRLFWRQVGDDVSRLQSRGLDWIINVGGTAALVLLAVGCSYPGNRFMDWLAWAPVIGLHVWIRRGLPGRWTAREAAFVRKLPAAPQQSVTPTAGRFQGQATTESAIPLVAPRRHDASATFEGGKLLDETLLQEVRRIRGEDGIETVGATLRAEFVAGQRHALLHVGFCPPLSHLPAVDVEAGEGPEAEVRVVQAFAHGTCLEVRLAEPAKDACSVLVELSATPRR